MRRLKVTAFNALYMYIYDYIQRLSTTVIGVYNDIYTLILLTDFTQGNNFSITSIGIF